jgi:hypothetical protein
MDRPVCVRVVKGHVAWSASVLAIHSRTDG